VYVLRCVVTRRYVYHSGHEPEWPNTEIWPKWNIPELTPSRLEATIDTKRNQGGQVLYEVSNVAGEDTGTGLPFPFTIDESRHSTLRKLLHVTVYCFKFICAKVTRCSTYRVNRNFGMNTVMGNMFQCV